MDKRKWNTYHTAAYTYQAGTDPRATGGVHHHQVRHTRGGWQRRTVDANGPYRSAGPVEPIDAARGAALWSQAEEY